MSKKPDGGPAFPRPATLVDRKLDWTSYEEGQIGLSLRDWFAGQALVGRLGSGREVFSDSLRAADAFALADAMLAEREKEKR